MAQSGNFGVNYLRVWTAAQFASMPPAALLDRGSNKKGEFLFVKATTAIAQYAAVGVDGEGDAAELTTTTYATSCAFGFAQVAIGAGEYGYIWVGKGGGTGSGIKGLFSANYAAFAVINTTATAGVVDDAATKILGGVVGLTLVGGAQASAELYAADTIHKVTA